MTGDPDAVRVDAEKPPRPGLRARLGRILLDTRPLKILAYRRLWLSSTITVIGAQLSTVAVPKQLFDLTGSSAYVGLAGLFGVVPLIIFGIWGGAVADTVDRRKLLLVTNTGIAVTALLLWAQAATGIGSVWTVLSLFAVQQAFFAMNMPARSAAIARLVPLDQLPAAQALGSTVFMFAAVFGPLAAGSLIAVLGLPTLYLIDAIALCATLWAVWKLPPLPPLNGPSRRAGLGDVVDGFRNLVGQKVLLASFLLDIIAMVAGMPRALYPEMAVRTFGDPEGGGFALGWLYAAMPLGALIFGLFSGWSSRVSRHGVALTFAIIGWGLSIIGLGLATELWVAVLFLALGGAADVVSMIFRGAMLQQAVTDDMRGRTQGVFTVVVAGGPRFADLAHGTAGAAFGTAIAVSGGGVLVIVLTVLAVVCIPVIWRYRAPISGDQPSVDQPRVDNVVAKEKPSSSGQ
ncbi:MFS transporter [Crossiella sp. NPDC003009]